MGMTSDDAAQYVLLPIYREQLGQAMDFSPSDVEANRAGRLSASQRLSLYKLIARSAALATVFVVLTGLSVVSAFLIGVTTGLGLLVLLLAFAFAAFIAIFARYNIPLWRDVNAGTVSSSEGMVRPIERETDLRTGVYKVPIWAYYWMVGNTERFWVTGKAFAALTPAPHRVYYLPQSRRVVAAEAISVAV